MRGKAFQYVEELGGRTILKMVYILGGIFMMGLSNGESSSDEKPQHQATISPFLYEQISNSFFLTEIVLSNSY